MRRAALLLPALLFCSCSKDPEANVRSAANAISVVNYTQEIKNLASDDFEGRKPGTQGENMTVSYMKEQFQAAGLQPGNPDGTWVQKVPLAGVTSKADAKITVGGKPVGITMNKDFIADTRRYEETVDVKDSDVVFVGYGVVAPEYGWDDYKGIDVKGKTILMLVNDPQVPDPADPSKLDEKMFRGRAMTYYGRWTYKYEIASEKGAAAAIIIHETPMAGYPFEVLLGSVGENFYVQRPDNNAGRVPVQGWITADRATELIKAAGLDLAALKKQAVTKDFKPVPLKGAKATFHLENKLRKIDSQNVVAKLEGSDPAHKDEWIIYTAHWDHLGRDTTKTGDQIFNGARDNASGTAGLIEIARAFKRLSPGPKRSVLFIALTGEEQGLLGAEYYAENPLYPLKKTLADINMDSLNVWGRTKDMTIVGLGNSTLDDVAKSVLAAQQRTVRPDPFPEKGFYFRSDHFEFAKQGVPALDPDPGIDYIGKPEGYGSRIQEKYDAEDYHKPSDEMKPDWDLSGAIDDLKVFFEIGFRVGEADPYPQWTPGTEFKAKRDAMMK